MHRSAQQNCNVVRTRRAQGETLNEQRRWSRITVEAVVIVASILFAFGIDAWWEGLREARDEAESLVLVSRDLQAAIEQLEEFQRFAEEKSEAALSAFESLSHPDEIDHTQVSRHFESVADRRTISLPSAAYTDLVSTGSLRIIKDRTLRDAIVRFYESAERIELILEKNNTVFIDQNIFGLWSDGLMLARAREVRFMSAGDAAREAIATRLGDDFEYGADYFWSFPPDSPEWHRVKSRLNMLALTLLTGKFFAQEVIDDAGALRATIQEAMEGT